MKNTNTVHTEIHYAPVGDYQLPLLTLPQTDDPKPLGNFAFSSRQALVFV